MLGWCSFDIVKLPLLSQHSLPWLLCQEVHSGWFVMRAVVINIKLFRNIYRHFVMQLQFRWSCRRLYGTVQWINLLQFMQSSIYFLHINQVLPNNFVRARNALQQYIKFFGLSALSLVYVAEAKGGEMLIHILYLPCQLLLGGSRFPAQPLFLTLLQFERPQLVESIYFILIKLSYLNRNKVK